MIYITTDTSFDMPKDVFQSLKNVAVQKIIVRLEDKDYEDLDSAYMFKKLREGKVVTTSAINEYNAFEFFDNIAKEGHDIIHLPLSAGLSGTSDNNKRAMERIKEKYPNGKFYSFNSNCASSGLGMLVYFMAKKRDEGATFEELIEYLIYLKDHISHYVIVDDLMFLMRGGRVSKAQAIAGTLLQLKPLVYLNEDSGKLLVYKKVPGRKKSIIETVNKMEEKMINDTEQTVFIAHGDCLADAEFMAEQVKNRFNIPAENIHIDYFGPVVGCHTGPGTLVLIYLCKDRHEAVTTND